MGINYRIQELLGSEEHIGKLNSELDIARLVGRGVPIEAANHFLAAAGLTWEALGIDDPNRYRTSRGQCEERLGQEESDQLVRTVIIVATAIDVFGDAEKARIWLLRKNRVCGGETPLAMAATHQEARVVETLLGRISHGIAA